MLGALALAPAGEARGACPQTGDPVVLRPVRDTRIMKAHPSANDGAAGLVWLKRSSHVRGLVGFDLSCQAAATPNLDCAELEVSIYAGSPRVDGSYFDAHKMLVPWIEGNQSFNEFKHGGVKLGPFGGNGVGTTWDCRTDPDLTNTHSDNCQVPNKWKGADDCGNGVPCYNPSASTAVYADDDQTSLAWEVTPDVLGADGDTSWLLKVQDETVKSGAVKFYTRDGAAFMAEHEPLPGGGLRFDSAPRLLLWGSNLATPTATLVSPVGNVSASPTQVRITQLGATTGSTARWTNVTTGGWGWMSADGASDWTAAIPLTDGANQIDFTVFDACGTEGKVRKTITLGSVVGCGGGDPEDCVRAFLCYGARVTSHTERFQRVNGLALSDILGTGPVDVKKLTGICVPADVDGDGVSSPGVHGVVYKAKSSPSGPVHEPQTGIVLTDRFGTSTLSTLRVDGIFAPGALAFGTVPPPLGGGTDPYKCYRVAPSGERVAMGLKLRITDPFEDRLYRIRNPSRVCYPPADDETAAPLLCYRVARDVSQPRHRRIRRSLHIADTFGPLAIDTRSEDELCVSAVPG